jgi:hypothetical protein
VVVVVQARKVLDSRSATEESADLVTIARYLVEAVANEEITVEEAELAIVEWTHDRGLLRTPVGACRSDEGAAWLLQRVSGRCHWAA